MAAYNRTTSKVDDFLNNEAKGMWPIETDAGRHQHCRCALD